MLWADEEGLPGSPRAFPSTPKTSRWANEESRSYTPKGTPTTATYQAFGLPNDFGQTNKRDKFAALVNKTLGKDVKQDKGHTRQASDDGEEWNRDPPPLYKKHDFGGTIAAWSTVVAAYV